MTTPTPRSELIEAAFKALCDRAIAVLQEHILPDSALSDHEALNLMYAIFDGPEQRAAYATPSAAGAPVVEGQSNDTQLLDWIEEHKAVPQYCHTDKCWRVYFQVEGHLCPMADAASFHTFRDALKGAIELRTLEE